MDNKIKDIYLVCAGFFAAGLILLFSSNFLGTTSIIGLALSALGGLGFWKPKVGEVLLHWAKKQEKISSQNNSKQTQKNTKNSSQASTSSGNIYIYHGR